MRVARSDKWIFISQRKYTLDLLQETGMLGIKPPSSPIGMNHRKREEEPVNRKKIQMMVGKLIYLSHTRPDIAYAVSVASQFMHNPFLTLKQFSQF